MGLYVKKNTSTWVTAKSVWVKNASAAWTPVKKIFVKALSGWVQFWPKSGPITTTPPFFSTDTAGNTQPSNSSTFTLPVNSTCYLQKGTWDGNGGTISSYSYQIAISNNSTIGTTKTNTSDSGSMINYASISLTDTTYDGQYIIGTVTATRTDSGTGVDSTDSNNYRYFVMRANPPRNISKGTDKLIGVFNPGDVITYTGTWNGTSAYLPDKTIANVAWYRSTLGPDVLTTPVSVINNATFLSVVIPTISNDGTTYTVTATYTTNNTTDINNYFYAIDTEQNSNSLYNSSPVIAMAATSILLNPPVVQTAPTITVTSPSGYLYDSSNPKSNTSAMPGSTIVFNTGTWSPAPNGTYAVSWIPYWGSSSNATSNTNNLYLLIGSTPTRIGGFDTTQNQNHSITLTSLISSTNVSPTYYSPGGYYLTLNVLTKNGNAVSLPYNVSPILMQNVPIAPGAPVLTYTSDNNATVYWSFSTSWSYEVLQYSTDGGVTWNKLGSNVTTQPTSTVPISYSGLPSGSASYRVVAYNPDGVGAASSTTTYNSVHVPTNSVAPYWTTTSGAAVSAPFYPGTYRLNFGTWSGSPTGYYYQLFYNNLAGQAIYPPSGYASTTATYIDYTFPANNTVGGAGDTTTIAANVYTVNAGGQSSTVSALGTFGPIVPVPPGAFTINNVADGSITPTTPNTPTFGLGTGTYINDIFVEWASSIPTDTDHYIEKFYGTAYFNGTYTSGSPNTSPSITSINKYNLDGSAGGTYDDFWPMTGTGSFSLYVIAYGKNKIASVSWSTSTGANSYIVNYTISGATTGNGTVTSTVNTTSFTLDMSTNGGTFTLNSVTAYTSSVGTGSSTAGTLPATKAVTPAIKTATSGTGTTSFTYTSPPSAFTYTTSNASSVTTPNAPTLVPDTITPSNNIYIDFVSTKPSDTASYSGTYSGVQSGSTALITVNQYTYNGSTIYEDIISTVTDGNETYTVTATGNNKKVAVNVSTKTNALSWTIGYTISGATAGNGSSAISTTSMPYTFDLSTYGGTLSVTSVTAYQTSINSGLSTLGTAGSPTSTTPTVATATNSTTQNITALPGAPVSLTTVANNGSVTFGWSAPTTGSATRTGYYYSSSTTNSEPAKASWSTTTSTSVTISGTNGTPIYFWVRAYNSRGYGGALTGSGTPVAPVTYTISFSSNAYYGSNVFIGSTTVQGSTTGPVGTVVTFGTPGAISGYTFLGWRDTPNVASYIYQFSAGQTWTIGQSGTTNMTFWPWYTQNATAPSAPGTPTLTYISKNGTTSYNYSATWSASTGTTPITYYLRAYGSSDNYTNQQTLKGPFSGTSSGTFTLPQTSVLWKVAAYGTNSVGSGPDSGKSNSA